MGSGSAEAQGPASRLHLNPEVHIRITIPTPQEIHVLSLLLFRFTKLSEILKVDVWHLGLL